MLKSPCFHALQVRLSVIRTLDASSACTRELSLTLAWLQVLPTDVDYRVMLTFLEFYQSLVKFVNFKLYHMLGAPYPPSADPKLQAAAADLAAIMQDLAQPRIQRAGAPFLLLQSTHFWELLCSPQQNQHVSDAHR